ncbi:MAG: acyltransferase [Desulfobulbaceae bacterium]
MSRRTEWIDYAKGIGIILVVFAHLQSSGFHAGLGVGERFFHLSDSIIYSFHMPLFFFLAGLLARASLARRGAKGFVLDKLRRIAWPYLVWSLIQMGVELFFSGHSSRGVTPADILAVSWRPWAQFWFLYSLLLMYLSATLIRHRGGLPLLAAVSLVLFFFPARTEMLSLIGFSTGFLFFVAGMIGDELLLKQGEKKLPGWAGPALLPVLVGAGWLVFTRLIAPVRLIDGSHPWLFLPLAALGIWCCLGTAQVLAEKKALSLVALLGRYSLPIYLVHMLAGVGTRVVVERFIGLEHGVVHLAAGLAVGLAAPVLLFLCCERLGFPWLFAFGAEGGPGNRLRAGEGGK